MGSMFGKDNIIPIPKSWVLDGTADKLLNDIEEKLHETSGAKIKILSKPEDIDLVYTFFPSFFKRHFNR